MLIFHEFITFLTIAMTKTWFKKLFFVVLLCQYKLVTCTNSHSDLFKQHDESSEGQQICETSISSCRDDNMEGVYIPGLFTT